MATIVPWTTMEIGDLEIFAPAPPCLVVHTSYRDDEPESSVAYFWQDEDGTLRSEVVFLKPVSFDEALDWAQEHAAAKDIGRIHVRHRPAPKSRPRAKKQARGAVGKRKAARGRKTRHTTTKVRRR